MFDHKAPPRDHRPPPAPARARPPARIQPLNPSWLRLVTRPPHVAREPAPTSRAVPGAAPKLIERAAAEASAPLEAPLRSQLSTKLGTSLEGVAVHEGAASEAAAEHFGARAFTVGRDVFLGREGRLLPGSDRRRLLAHEATHAVQQGLQPAAFRGELPVSRPHDPAENEADRVADAVAPTSDSPARGGPLRATPTGPALQRSIKDTQTWNHGELSIDFTKHDGTTPGEIATEQGRITFTPFTTCPQTDSIRFVQIVRNVDTTTGTDLVQTGDKAPFNSQRTTADASKNVAGGFWVDQLPGVLSPRTAKSDPKVLPFHDVVNPRTDNIVGKARGTTLIDAVLSDEPGGDLPVKFSFVTAAKATDTGVWLGTVLWGFEVFRSGSFAKIRNEYHSFRSVPGETMEAAIGVFDSFMKNPGTPNAPK